jgi:hypothetical protein
VKRIIVLAALIAFVLTGSSFAIEDIQKQFKPKRVEVDSNYDGKVDRIETYDENGVISRVDVDSMGKGVMDEWVIYKNGIPLKKEKDSNGDGKADVWVNYQ